jgi:hypothetical protein
MADEETTETSPNPPVAKVFRIQETDRSKLLRWRSSFCEGQQHDHCHVTWSGKARYPGVSYFKERLVPLGFQSTTEVSYEDRRPSCPIPLARQVTNRFTDMLMSAHRRPTLAVPGDGQTEAYLAAVFEKSDMWDTLASVRNAAGACGSCAVLPAVDNGTPTSERLRAEDIWVPKWSQTNRWIPEIVFHQRLVEEMVENEDTGALEVKRLWRTRAWDETHEYRYKDVPENYGKDKSRDIFGDGSNEIPLDVAIEHGAGRCPVVWVQNTRNTEAPEGEPDNDGVYELADQIDRIASMLTRGTIANVDPTLHIADDERHQRRHGAVRKGWGSVIRTSEKGKVNLVQITEGSFKVGWSTYDKLRQAYLQTVRCVIVDPETAGKYQSGEAQSMLWRAMEGACDGKRTPLADALRQLSEIWIALAEQHGIGNETDPESGGIQLPPVMLTLKEAVARGYDVEPEVDREALRIEKAGEFKPESGLDEETWLDSEEETALEDLLRESMSYTHVLGEGRAIDVVWGPYHDPTLLQTQALATALGLATGQKQILSSETATSVFVRHLNLGSPENEIEKIVNEKERAVETFGAGMFGDVGEEQKADANNDERLDEGGSGSEDSTSSDDEGSAEE